jgi:hypothetical protein
MYCSSSKDSKNWTKFPGYYHRISIYVSIENEKYFFQNNKILDLPLPQFFTGQPWILFQYNFHSSNCIRLYTCLTPHNSKTSPSKFFTITIPRFMRIPIRNARSLCDKRFRICRQLQEAKKQNVSHGGSPSQSPRFGHPLTACKWLDNRSLVMGDLKSKSTFRASTDRLQGVRYQIVSPGGHQVKVHASGIHLLPVSGQITDR